MTYGEPATNRQHGPRRAVRRALQEAYPNGLPKERLVQRTGEFLVAELQTLRALRRGIREGEFERFEGGFRLAPQAAAMRTGADELLAVRPEEEAIEEFLDDLFANSSTSYGVSRIWALAAERGLDIKILNTVFERYRRRGLIVGEAGKYRSVD